MCVKQLKNQQCLEWLAAYCWLGVAMEKSLTSSQDVASLPPLGAPCLLTSYLFVFVKATFPEPGLRLVLFFLCCLRRSQLEGQESWSGKALHVCHRWLRGRAGPAPAIGGLAPVQTGRGWGLSGAVPWGRQRARPPCFKVPLLRCCGRAHVNLQRPCRHSSCGGAGGSSTRQPEVPAMLSKSHTHTHTRTRTHTTTTHMINWLPSSQSCWRECACDSSVQIKRTTGWRNWL